MQTRDGRKVGDESDSATELVIFKSWKFHFIEKFNFIGSNKKKFYSVKQLRNQPDNYSDDISVSTSKQKGKYAMLAF